MVDNRGGARTGVPGRAYTNRTDLAQNRVAISTPSTGTYGEAADQRRSLQAVPAGVPKLPPLNRPTEFPNEPITAGMSRGPGPGPESLAPIASAGPTPSQQELERMRGLVPALEVIASLPDTSPIFRAFVRDLRGRVRST
jgi:hypothetical protein